MGSGDPKLDHAVDFTDREIRTLTYWLAAAQAGDAGTAGRILSTGLLAEHYNSLLPDDPAARTDQEKADLATLNLEADKAIQSFSGPAQPIPTYPYGGGGDAGA